jgi:paraquat-inducible protein A
VLYRHSFISLNGWLALTAGALIFFAIAHLFPVAVLNIQGVTVKASFPGALFLTWEQGHRALAVMTGLLGFWFPLIELLFLLWALLAIWSGRLPRDFPYGMRLMHFVAPWSMTPVVLLGILIAMVQFSGLATLHIGPALGAFGALTVLMTALSRMSAHRIWQYAEDAGVAPAAHADALRDQVTTTCLTCGYIQPAAKEGGSDKCQRCHARIHYRKPEPANRVWALIIAATITYIPANVLPVMQVRGPTGAGDHTILGGVLRLWEMDSWGLAIIVFAASVVVPMTKLLALAALLLGRHWKGRVVQRQRTRLYELIEFIGQWSMLDVFVVILLGAMANFPGISQIIPGPGAVSFGLVVILTMLATFSYDPRRGWDRAPPRFQARAVQSASAEAGGHPIKSGTVS